jgi:hypothetical protein
MGLFDGIISATGLDTMSQGGASLAGGLIGGLGSFLGQQSANQANAQLADKQMQFQQESRATAYQTAVKDMMAAGLNPMLAYQQGGAGNQPGASAQMQNAIGAGVTSATHAIDKYQQLQNLTSQNELIHSQIDDTNASAVLKRATAITEAYKPGLTQAQTNEILTKAGLNVASTKLTTAQEAESKQRYTIAKPEEAMSKTPYGQTRPYLKDALQGITSATSAFGKFK